MLTLRTPGHRAAVPAAAALLLGGLVALAGCSSGAAPKPSTGSSAGSAAGSAAGGSGGGRPAGSPSGSPSGVAAGDAVTVFELADPIVRYQAYVADRLAVLDGQVQALSRAVTAGDLAASRADWLAAHLTYHALGAAYGAFGDAGQAIDGTASGLPGGPADPRFTGFHRVELALWSGGGTAAAVAPAARLAQDVAALRARAGRLEISANDFTTRAHEILEDTLRSRLTRRDDYGSGSGLATAAADAAATRTVVGLLRPILAQHHPDVVALLDRRLTTLDGALHPAGAPVPLRSLGRPQRQRIDAAMGAALEELAVLPGLLHVEEEDEDE